MKKIIIVGFLLIAGMILTSSGWLTLNNSQTKPTTQVSSQGSLEEFLKKNNASSEIAQAYRFALENPQNILSTVRCYCGCLKNQNHNNSRDCFINEDGSFDLMGLNCGLCVKTALTAKQMLSEGKTVQEISEFVDSKWGKE